MPNLAARAPRFQWRKPCEACRTEITGEAHKRYCDACKQARKRNYQRAWRQASPEAPA